MDKIWIWAFMAKVLSKHSRRTTLSNPLWETILLFNWVRWISRHWLMQSRLAYIVRASHNLHSSTFAKISPKSACVNPRLDTFVAILLANLIVSCDAGHTFEVSRHRAPARYQRVRRSCKTNWRKRILLSVFIHTRPLLPREHIHTVFNSRKSDNSSRRAG